MAQNTTSGLLPFDESLSFLDELMNLEGIDGEVNLPEVSSNVPAGPAEAAFGREQAAAALYSQAAPQAQPEASFPSFPHPQSSGLPDMPMDFGSFEAEPPAEGPSHKEKARATQKRFRSRQKVGPYALIHSWLL